VPEEAADRALAALRAHPLGRAAARIGTVTDTPRGLVVVETALGSTRVLERPYGELLPGSVDSPPASEPWRSPVTSSLSTRRLILVPRS
jgi:hypothetical protein